MSPLTVPGAEIYYEVSRKGPALVFAHGLGGNHGTADPAAYADDVHALIDHLGLTEVRLVARSMGGWTCLDYTLRSGARESTRDGGDVA